MTQAIGCLTRPRNQHGKSTATGMNVLIGESHPAAEKPIEYD